MANITPVDLDTEVSNPVFTAASSGGDKILPPGGSSRIVLAFTNNNAAARTVTVTAQEINVIIGGYGLMRLKDKVLELAAGDTTPTFGFVEIPKQGFNDTADGDNVAVTYSSEVGVSLIAFALSAGPP